MYGQVAQFFPQRKEPEGSGGWGLVELENVWEHGNIGQFWKGTRE